MRLSELRTGEKGVIVKVMGRGAFRKRIIEMGFIRGKEVDVIQNAPLKDPIHYRVIGYDISLRRNDAQMIEVVSAAEFTEAGTEKPENRPVDSYMVGLVISRADVPPIIATMGFMYIYRAMGYLVSHNGEWASAAALGEFKDFATTKFLGMSLVIWVIILCYVIFFVFMKWTTIGRRIYAVGSNPSAAEVSGI